MSAFSVGNQVSTIDSANAKTRTKTKTPESSAPAAFVKWIPGEAITFYAAIIGISAAQAPLTGEETAQQLLERIDADDPGWFLLGLGLTAVLVIVGALDAWRTDSERPSLVSVCIRIVFSMIAFTIWTSALPGSWPFDWHWIRDMGAAYALLLVPVALIFSTFAELLTRRSTL